MLSLVERRLMTQSGLFVWCVKLHLNATKISYSSYRKYGFCRFPRNSQNREPVMSYAYCIFLTPPRLSMLYVHTFIAAPLKVWGLRRVI